MTDFDAAPDIAGVRSSLTQVKDTTGTKVFRALNTVFLTLLTLVTIYPFVNLVAKSFSSEARSPRPR